ncbi:MAG: hypothetical protein JWM40_1401 [Frankiales bacterium]|nr:hypothetical protein [Frankiales bacterium]
MTEVAGSISPDGRWTWDGQQWVPRESPVAPPPSGTDTKAIVSLVLGVLWLGGLASVGAIVLGHLSRSEARRDGRAPSGLALAGLILGYIGASFIVVGILAAIAIPVFLNQSQKGDAAAVKLELRDVAQLEETHRIDNDSYTTDTDVLRYVAPTNVRVVILSADASGYCIRATHTGSEVRWYYEASQGLTSAPCG